MLDTSDILVRVIIEGMLENKAKEIVSMNLKEIETAVCDYFIICNGIIFINDWDYTPRQQLV